MSAPRILINALSLSRVGGSRSYVRNLLRELDRDARGFDFTVLTSTGALSSEEAGGIAVRRVSLPERRALARALKRVAYEELALPLRGRAFDVLYCLADLSPAWGSTPTVVALRNHNIYDRRYSDSLRLRVLQGLVKLGARRATRLVCPTAAAADTISLSLGLPRDRITVVHHGISPEAFEGPAEPIPSERPYLFLPANLERHKNIPVLFEALGQLRDAGIELWIAGNQDLDPDWGRELRRQVAQRGLEKRVRFLGSVPYQDILRYHRGASALVFPSLLETFGHPLLEAMLSGTPIVSADLPSSREVAGDAALYFDPHDARGLTDAIEATLEDGSSTRERVARGRELVRRFTWQRSVDELCRTFERALSEGAGSSSPR